MEAMVGTALFSAGGTAVGTTGLLGAAGSFGLGGTLFSAGTGTLLSGLMTGASALSQVQAGNMNATILNMQARQSELNARMEGLKGRQQALSIKNQLDKDLASTNATFAARGVLQGEGSAQAAMSASMENASQDIENARFGADMASESDRIQASQTRTEAKYSKIQGRQNAMQTIGGSRTFGSLLENL